MAGYTRQSSSSIVNGSDITAAPLNAEFNQVLAALNNTTGHKHDGTAAEGPVIGLIGDPGVATPLNKVVVDNTNNRVGVFVDASGAGSTVEQVRIQDGAIVPVTDNDIDLGTSSVEFKDLFLDGTAHVDTLDVDANATVAGTLGVAGNSTLSGNLTVTGNTTIGNAASDTVTVTADVASPLIPSADDTYDLGASGSEWRNLYVDGTANIDALVADTADINGGSIDGAVIGAASAAAGTFTDLTSTGTSTHATVDINGGAIDGTIIGASTAAAGSFTTVSTSGQATLATVDINGGAIDGTIIGVATPAAVTGTTITGTSLVGPLTGTVAGNVTGNVAGNLTGNVTGNLTGNVTGNVTAASGTSSFTDVTITGDVAFGDGDKALFGAGSDLQIYHDSGQSRSVISEVGTGPLRLETNGSDISFMNTSPIEYLARFQTGGSVELYFDGSKVFETASGGVDVTGNITASGTVDGRDLATDGGKLDLIEASADVTDTTNVTAAGALMDSEVTNLAQVKAFSSSDYATAAQGTTADAAMPTTGGTFSGDVNFGDGDKAIFGAGSDIQIYHDASGGGTSYINGGGAGNLLIIGDDLYLNSSNGENMIKAIEDGAVTLYFNGASKLQTSASGADVTGRLQVDNGSTSSGYIDLLEDSDNGTNKIKLEAPQIVASDKTITLPDHTGTVGLHTDLVTGDLLHTIEVTSNVSEVEFGSTYITDDYETYDIVIDNWTNNTAANYYSDGRMHFKINGAYATTSTWAWYSSWTGQRELDSYESNSYSGIHNTARLLGYSSGLPFNSEARFDYHVRLNALRETSTSINPTYKAQYGRLSIGGTYGSIGTEKVVYARQWLNSGLLQRPSTHPVEAVRFTIHSLAGSQISGGTFKLYGMGKR